METQSDISFETARAAWLEDCRFRRLSPETLREYERVSARAGSFIAVQLRHQPQLSDLRAVHIRHWLTDRPRPLQPASVAAYVRTLRAFSRWCAREYAIPAPLAGLQPPRVEPPPIAVFDGRQLRALLDAAPPHLAYAITLLAESGLRVSEAIVLQLDDVAAPWLSVRRGKGGRGRRVPISAVLQRATRIYLSGIRPSLGQPQTSALLVAAHGQPWTADAMRRALRRLGKRAGVSGVRVSPHTFRHQFAHAVAFSGGSLIALRDVLGHRTVRMVERYAVPDDAARLALLPDRTPLQQLDPKRYGRRKSRVNGDDAS